MALEDLLTASHADHPAPLLFIQFCPFCVNHDAMNSKHFQILKCRLL